MSDGLSEYQKTADERLRAFEIAVDGADDAAIEDLLLQLSDDDLAVIECILYYALKGKNEE